MSPLGTRRTPLSRLLVATLAVGLAQAPGALAFEREDVTCELEDLTRKLALRVDPDAGYVCDVLYLKPDEGNAREVLWSARNDAEYCRPRFESMVEGLASRGWTCGYSEEEGESDDQPAMGAARDERAEDDEASSEGVKGRFRDRCIADAASGENVSGEGSVKSYCGCVADGMDSYGLSEEDVELIFGGLSAASGGAEDGSANGDKRLNTLAANYDGVVDSCR